MDILSLCTYYFSLLFSIKMSQTKRNLRTPSTKLNQVTPTEDNDNASTTTKRNSSTPTKRDSMIVDTSPSQSEMSQATTTTPLKRT